MLVISIQWASRFWLGWQVLAHPSWLEGYMLRRFARDCSCLFTASQIAPENSPNVAIPTSGISLSDIAIYATYDWQSRLSRAKHTLGCGQLMCTATDSG